MVSSAEGFNAQPKVINGFSDLMVEVFGENGRHARSAVGMAGASRRNPRGDRDDPRGRARPRAGSRQSGARQLVGAASGQAEDEALETRPARRHRIALADGAVRRSAAEHRRQLGQRLRDPRSVPREQLAVDQVNSSVAGAPESRGARRSPRDGRGGSGTAHRGAGSRPGAPAPRRPASPRGSAAGARRTRCLRRRWPACRACTCRR